MSMSRSAFLRNSTFLVTSFTFPGIISSCLRSDNSPDVVLDSDLDNLANTVKQQFGRIKNIVDNSGDIFRIGLSDREVIQMSFIKTKGSDYKHVRFERESNGDAANLTIERDGVYPVVQLTDDEGEILSRDGEDLSFSFRSFVSEDNDESWLEIGIKITAIALALWLGLSIARGILAGLAFLAFNAMVLGLVVASISFLSWIIEATGWNVDDVRDFFDQTVAEIKQFFERIINALQ